MHRLIAGALAPLLVAVLAGCGGGTTKTVTVGASEASKTTAAVEGSQKDSDGDGVNDAYDAAPLDASIPDRSEPEPEEGDDSTGGTAEPTEEETCGDFELSGKEGLCKDDDGDRFKIADRGNTLSLPELKATFDGYTTEKTISSDTGTERASGTFVIVRLTITNETESPVSFEPDNTTLQIGTRTYSTDFDAENSPGDSFVWNSDDLQPEQPKTGTVIFDVPTKRISKLDSDALVLLPQFSDDGYDESTNTATGALRTYTAG